MARKFGQLPTAKYHYITEPVDDNDTISKLINRIKNGADFPSFYQNFVEINEKLTSTYASTVEIANSILKDYSLTSKLLKLVNSAFYGQFRDGVTTISQAVILLGINQVQMAAASLMFFEHMQSTSHTSELKEASIRSLMSGLVARELAQKVGIRKTEEACICAMLYQLGEYLVLYYMPDEYADIMDLVSGQRMSKQQASRKILGISYRELGINIAKQWGLPAKIIASMQKLPKKEDAAKTDILQSISHFSNQLCDIALTADSNSRMLALEDVQSKLNLTRTDIQDLYDSVWTQLSKHSSILNINFKESNLLVKFAANFIVNDKVVLKDENVAEITDDFQDIISSGIENITRLLLEDNFELTALLSMVLEVIYMGFGFTRVVICISETDGKFMSARYGLGKDINKFIQNFRFKLDFSDDLFNLALNKEQDVYIENLKDPKFGPYIPDWYVYISKAYDIIIYPIIVKNRLVGMFYADREQSRPKYSKQQLKYLNILRNQAALAIKQKSR